MFVLWSKEPSKISSGILPGNAVQEAVPSIKCLHPLQIGTLIESGNSSYLSGCNS